MITRSNVRTLKDLLETAAIDYENNVFLRYEKDGIIYEKGYRTFAMDARAISNWVQQKSKEAGRKLRIALIGKCNYEYLTVLMGVACAGSIAIPMDVQLSKQGFKDNLTKAEVDYIFFDYEYMSEVSFLKGACPFLAGVICLQKRKHHFSAVQIHREYRITYLETDVKPEDCAVIIFTSGTTGRGKGVMLSHANVINDMFTIEGQRETNMSILPIHHVFCLSGDLFFVLRYGSTLCLCDDVSKMLYYLDLYQPTMIRIVPMMAKMLVNKVTILSKQNPDRSIEEIKHEVMGRRLKKIASGGGYLSETLAKSLLDLGITTGQGYGMSECSPKISSPEYGNIDKLASVGRPVPGTQIRFVDGEIQVKSPSVMMGYYNDPELTKEAITYDGWLCTGDLGYMDEDGFLYLNGRKKNLIILSNGENVSPELIENKFDGDRLIQDVIAYGENDTISVEVYPNFEYAQINKIKDIPAAIDQIVAQRNEELPSYAKIANCTVRKHPFEKTSSKKIIRKVYFDKKSDKQKKEETFKKAASPMQETLYSIVTLVIGNDLGVDMNMYQNGLDSLGSVMLIEELQKQLDMNVTLSEIMENNTIEKLEVLYQEKMGQENVDYTPRPAYPLTGMMMYFSYIIAGNTTGNLPYIYRLDPKVDLDRLKESFQILFDTHPSLKGIIKPTPQKYYAYFREDERVMDIPVYQWTEADVEDALRDMIKPFTYREDDNLVHIALGETKSYKYMFFDVAHVISDGISMGIVMEDLKKIYDGEQVEKEKYSFYEYILDYDNRQKNGGREKDIAYVDGLMKGHRMTQTLLTRHDRKDYSEGKSAVIKRTFDRIVRKKVLYYCKQHNVSENAFFLSAFNYCISLFADQDDVFLNSIHSGRTDGRWTRLSGCLFNTYFCRYNMIPHETTENFVKRMGNQIMDTMQSFTPVSRMGDMFLQYQGDILQVPTPGEMPGERVRCQLDSIPFHMQIMCNDEIFWTELRYWENRFDEETLELFLRCFEEVARAITDEEPSTRRLKRHLPENVFPKHFYVNAQRLNEEAGFELLPGTRAKDKVKVYIMDESYHKKPYAAWGPLYVMDYEPASHTEILDNPYGPGTLYGTGLKARILLDGTVDFLHVCGKELVKEGVKGRRFIDLKETEKALLAYPGVTMAEAYLKYNTESNELDLYADVQTTEDFDKEACLAYLKENCQPVNIPLDFIRIS